MNFQLKVAGGYATMLLCGSLITYAYFLEYYKYFFYLLLNIFFYLNVIFSSIPVDTLEPEIREAVAKLKIEDKNLYYNKGL